MKISLEARDLAKKLGYPCIGYEGKWKGYTVYTPYFPSIDGVTPPTGLPVLILQKGNECRKSTTEEAFACLADLYPD